MTIGKILYYIMIGWGFISFGIFVYALNDLTNIAFSTVKRIAKPKGFWL